MNIIRKLTLSILFAAISIFALVRPAMAGEVEGLGPEVHGQQHTEEDVFQLFIPLVLDTPRPSSESLILAAEEQGEIDVETSLLYQFYALYNDARLPQRYRGDDRRLLDAQVPFLAALQYGQLSGAGQEALLPFLLPPVYTDSWYEIRRNGSQTAISGQGHAQFEPSPCIDLADGWTFIERYGFKVWLSKPGQMPTAEALIEELNDKIRPELQGLLNVTPLDDDGMDCNGGSDSYDIYILPANEMGGYAGIVGAIDRGVTTCKAPTFMTIADNLPLTAEQGLTLFGVLAHEYMHTMQHAYDFRACSLDRYSREGHTLLKWFEATAVWAGDFIYPDSDAEHSNVENYLKSNGRKWGGSNDEGVFFKKDSYDSYLFPFYLTHQANDDSLIARIYESWETYALPNEGVDKVINGGFRERWPEFALYNLNRPPFDYYRQWDRIPYTSQVAIDDIEMTALHPLIQKGEWKPGNFAGELHRYARAKHELGKGLLVVSNMDKVVENESIRLRYFPLTAAEELPAFEDQSDDKQFYRCLEQADPDTVGSLFVLTNSDIFRGDDGSPDALELLHLDMGCYKWQLQSSLVVETHWTDEEATWDHSTAVTASVVFSRSNVILNGGLHGLEFVPESGQIEVAVRGQLQNRIGTTNCAVDFTQPVAASDEAWFNVFIGIDGDVVQTGYIGQGVTEVSGVTWRNCLEEIEEIQGPVDWLYTRDLVSFEDGFTFSGGLTETIPLENEDGTQTLTHNWAFTALDK